jgi:hypothetical protein
MSVHMYSYTPTKKTKLVGIKLVIISDPHTNRQIAQVRVRVLNFAQQQG